MFICMLVSQIGGVGHVVEIDETSLKKKSKYNRGRRHPDFWLFGGVDRTTKQWFGRIVYDKRTKETLLPIIRAFIRPGTKIISDHFTTYVSVNEEHTLANEPYLIDMTIMSITL
jgi:ISXO2-like transposase domain